MSWSQLRLVGRREGLYRLEPGLQGNNPVGEEAYELKHLRGSELVFLSEGFFSAGGILLDCLKGCMELRELGVEEISKLAKVGL